MDAIDAADTVEHHERELLVAEWGHFDEFGEPLDRDQIEEEVEHALVSYRHTLKRLKAAFPGRSSTTALRRAHASTAGRALAAEGSVERGRGWCTDQSPTN